MHLLLTISTVQQHVKCSSAPTVVGLALGFSLELGLKLGVEIRVEESLV